MLSIVIGIYFWNEFLTAVERIRHFCCNIEIFIAVAAAVIVVDAINLALCLYSILSLTRNLLFEHSTYSYYDMGAMTVDAFITNCFTTVSRLQVTYRIEFE